MFGQPKVRLDRALYARAAERARKLGLPSVDAYVAELLQRDLKAGDEQKLRFVMPGVLRIRAAQAFAQVVQALAQTGARILFAIAGPEQSGEGAAAVQAYLETVWGDAIARFRLLAENTAPQRRR